MPRQSTPSAVATIGIDIGKNTFHLVGLDQRGAIVLQLKSSREQLERRLSNMPRCLIGMEACSGSHHIGRQLEALGHDVRLIPAQYVKPFLKGHKNDYRDAEAIAEAMQRPTMTFVTIKTPAQMDLLALHRVRSSCQLAHRRNQSNKRVPHRAWHHSPRLPILADGAGHRTDHLQRGRSRDRRRCRLQARPRLWRLAWFSAEIGVYRRSHDPGKDLQAG